MKNLVINFVLTMLLASCATNTCHTYEQCPNLPYSWDIGPPSETAIEKKLPWLIAGTPPIYPKEAWGNKIEGSAIFQFDVNPDGETINIVLVESDHPEYFTEAGIKAIKLSRYTKTPNGVIGLKRRFKWSQQ